MPAGRPKGAKDKKKRKFNEKSRKNLQYKNTSENVASFLCTYDPKLILPPRRTWFMDHEGPTEPGAIENQPVGSIFDSMGNVLVGNHYDQDSWDEEFKTLEIYKFQSMLSQSGQLSQIATFVHAIRKECGLEFNGALHWELSPKRRSIHAHFLLYKKCVGTRGVYTHNGIATATRFCRTAKTLNKRKGLFATCNIKVYKQENFTADQDHAYLTKGKKSGLYYRQEVL